MKNSIFKKICFLLMVFLVQLNAKAVSIPQSFFTKANIATPLMDSSKNIESAYASALKEFNGLSKAEKKAKFKSVKKILKAYKKQKNAGDDVTTNEILLAILCVVLPPLAVYLHQGKETNNKFWISLILSLLFWVPGIIYALLVVFGGL